MSKPWRTSCRACHGACTRPRCCYAWACDHRRKPAARPGVDASSVGRPAPASELGDHRARIAPLLSAQRGDQLDGSLAHLSRRWHVPLDLAAYKGHIGFSRSHQGRSSNSRPPRPLRADGRTSQPCRPRGSASWPRWADIRQPALMRATLSDSYSSSCGRIGRGGGRGPGRTRAALRLRLVVLSNRGTRSCTSTSASWSVREATEGSRFFLHRSCSQSWATWMPDEAVGRLLRGRTGAWRRWSAPVRPAASGRGRTRATGAVGGASSEGFVARVGLQLGRDAGVIALDVAGPDDARLSPLKRERRRSSMSGRCLPPGSPSRAEETVRQGCRRYRPRGEDRDGHRSGGATDLDRSQALAGCQCAHLP